MEMPYLRHKSPALRRIARDVRRLFEALEDTGYPDELLGFVQEFGGDLVSCLVHHVLMYLPVWVSCLQGHIHCGMRSGHRPSLSQ